MKMRMLFFESTIHVSSPYSDFSTSLCFLYCCYEAVLGETHGWEGWRELLQHVWDDDLQQSFPEELLAHRAAVIIIFLRREPKKHTLSSVTCKMKFFLSSSQLATFHSAASSVSIWREVKYTVHPDTVWLKFFWSYFDQTKQNSNIQNLWVLVWTVRWTKKQFKDITFTRLLGCYDENFSYFLIF